MGHLKIKASDPVKLDDGSESLDTFIRQAIGKEHFLSFSKPNDSPVQWIQLLHALDQQDLPGWPLLSPLKIQMQKCAKCSQEFCSTINYRRHMRLHRRNLNVDKDSSTNNRGLLQAFWDKLKPEETMEIMSFNDVSLEGVTGDSIMKAFTSFVRRPGFTSLPQSYVNSGSALLDIIHARPSRFPLTSQELFSILDDASEKTFLCAGPAESLQKYVFDGEAGKVGLELRNLVACTSFLIEQKLVKACLADKDAEALRYEKLLVEEEEAAQKRQAALSEKKRQKKLRQREQRTKEQASAETEDAPEDRSPSPPTSSSVDAHDKTPELPEMFHNATSCAEPVQLVNAEGDICNDHGDVELDLGAHHNFSNSGTYQNLGNITLQRSGRRHVVNSRWQAPKLQRIPSGFHTSHNYQVLRPGATQKHASPRDSRAAASSGTKVWTPKPKPKSEAEEDNYKTGLQTGAPNIPDQDKKHELLIGSIPVSLGKLSVQQQDETLSGGQLRSQNTTGASEVGGTPCNDGDVQHSSLVESNSNLDEENFDSSVEDGHKFSIQSAAAFLSERWKEAIASDHVKLVLSPEGSPGSPGSPEVQDDNREVQKLDERSSENP